MAQATSHQQDEVEDLKPAAGKITEVQGDSNFYETVTAAPLSAWSRTSVQLYLILLVAALNATTSGFDGVSRTVSHVLKSWLTQWAVDFQLHQCHETVSGVLPSHRTWIEHGNVSLTTRPNWRGIQCPAIPLLTSVTAYS